MFLGLKNRNKNEYREKNVINDNDKADFSNYISKDAIRNVPHYNSKAG